MVLHFVCMGPQKAYDLGVRILDNLIQLVEFGRMLSEMSSTSVRESLAVERI